MNFNLATSFYSNSIAHPEAPALSFQNVKLTYLELARLVRKVAATLQAGQVKARSRVAILASRSIEACTGTLGACWIGATYIPLSLKLPEERLIYLLQSAQPAALIVDARGAQLLTDRVMAACPDLILVPANCKITAKSNQQILSLAALSSLGSVLEPVPVESEDLAYIIYTSGTTGLPKGVMISAGSLHYFLSALQERYCFTPEDRVAATTEWSFDPSVINMFLTWSVGASLHVLPSAQAMAPAKFINDNAITVWCGVPSIIALMKRMNILKPGLLSSLRYSQFGGEGLTLTSVSAWQEAAPNSVIDCVYGPTEATIACSGIYVSDRPAITPERQIISIGYPFAGTEMAIVDSAMNFLGQGQRGELALAGRQLAQGYLNSPELTNSRFPTLDGKRWYLTGDLAYQDAAGRFHHLGRTDNQIKVLGHRIELEEIEVHLRNVCETELVAAVAWPEAYGVAHSIVSFVVGAKITPAQIRQALAQQIPSYMVPTTIRLVEALPLNANGKVDRKALIAQLQTDQ